MAFIEEPKITRHVKKVAKIVLAAGCSNMYCGVFFLQNLAHAQNFTFKMKAHVARSCSRPILYFQETCRSRSVIPPSLSTRETEIYRQFTRKLQAKHCTFRLSKTNDRPPYLCKGKVDTYTYVMTVPYTHPIRKN